MNKYVYNAMGMSAVRKMQETDLPISIQYFEDYISSLRKKEMSMLVEKYLEDGTKLLNYLKTKGVPVNSNGEVAICHENGIIYTYYLKPIYWDGIDKFNRYMISRGMQI